jgi:hypothetical protein
MRIREDVMRRRKDAMKPEDRSPFLPDDVIMRRLRMIRYSSRHERQARRAPSLRDIATRSEIQIDYLYRVLSGQRRLTDWLRERLSITLSDKVEG